jgi:YVTN family beta-propeller protein
MQSSLLACRRFVLLCLGTLIVSLVACPSLGAQSLVGTGSQPFAVAVNPATNKIYVVNNGPNTVTVIDGATNATRTVQVGTAPVAIAVNTVTNEVYVANSGGSVTIINEATGSTKTIKVDLNPQAIIVNPVTNKIYVAATNGKVFSTFNPNGNVVVIDGRTDTVTTTIPGGKNPFAIALNPVTNRIYVANDGNGSNATVTVIDGSTDTLAAGSPIGLGNTPNALAVNPVTNKIYVTNGSNLSVIDGVSNTIRTTTALPSNNLTAIAVNPVTNFIYITTQNIGIVMAVNGTTDTLSLSGIALIGGSPLALAVNSLTNLIYVTDNATTGRVVVIDGSTNNRVDSFITGNGPGAVAVNPVTNRVYVVNNRNNNVAVVDGATKTTSTINAGSNPFAVAVNQVTNQVYVPNMGDNTVTVIDAANGGITSTVNAGTGPTAVAVNPATNKVYVPNSGSGDVTVIDGLNGNATTQVSAEQGPFAVAVNTASNKAYVTNSTANSVTVIDGITDTTSNVTVGTAPKGLAINEVTNTIVVANQGSNNVTVINGETNAPLATVSVGGSPVAVGVNSSENNFYVVNQGSNDVTVIDGDTLQSIDLIRLGALNRPGAVVVNPLTNKIYVANQGTNSVSVIDGASGRVIATVGTGNLPYALDLNLLTNKIYVTNQNDATVTVIDGSGDTFSATVPTGSAPSGVAVNPITNQVYVSNSGSANVTVITVGAQQPVPLEIKVAPVVSGSDSFTSGGVFSTFNETPSFDVTVTSAYSSSDPYAGYIGTVTNPPPTQVYFSADGATPWSLATPTGDSVNGPTNPATFTITLSPLDSGLHTLYVFAAYGNGVGHNTSGNGTGNSPEISNLQRLPLLVLPNATTTALVSDAPNGAQEGTTITFTATVTENGSPVTEGLVQFYVDGKSQGLATEVNVIGNAVFTDNSLTSGSHTIQAVYLGTDKFLESSASLTQVIHGLPTLITVSSGNSQSAAVNTSYTSPLVAIVKDAVGDPVPNITVTWATNGTTIAPGGTLSAATSTTDANGLASVNVTANSKAGSFQVTASAVGTPAQFTLTNTAGAPFAITTHSGSPQTAVINTPFQPLTVLVTDTDSNPVKGVTVTYVSNGTTANASLNPASAATDDNGLAFVNATANGTTGSYTVTAAAVSVARAANFALTNSTATTATSLTAFPQTPVYGNTITFTATVDQSTATGVVNFFLGAELLGTAMLNAKSATLALNQIPGTGQYLPVGTYSNITATYTGDSNFAGSSSGPVQVTVTKKTAAGGGPALIVEANSVTRPFGQPNPAFSYTVEGALVPGDTAASAVTGTAVYTTSAVPGSLVGTYPLSVSGLVSANYDIAFQDGTVTVTQGSSTTSLAIGSANVMYGDEEVLTAGVNQGATGTVSFYDGTTLLGTASLDSTTHAELPVDNLPAGVHIITATFNGGPNLLPSTSNPPATLTVTQRTTGEDQAPALTIVVRNATRPATGEFAVFTYYVTGQLFNNDTYATAITGTPRLASPATSDPGTYPITISGLTSNNYTLTSVPGTLFVTDDAIGKPSTTTLTVNPSSGQYGDPITLTATTSPTVASGRVTFYDVLPSGATVFIGDATLSGGTASFVASTLSAGTHSIEAAYSGDGIYSTSISQPSTVTIAKKQGAGGGAALTIIVQNASRQFGTANPQFAFIVTGVTGTLVPGDSFDSAVTGVATYTTTDTSSSAVGTTYPITVTGLVSQNYEIATVPGTLTIVGASSTTTLAAAQTTGFTAAQYGDTVTLTANVAPTTATGTLVFLEGQNVLGTAPVGSGTGVASLALTTLQAGRHTITAMYLGDNNLGASTSTPVTIVVSQKTGPSGEPYLIVTANDASRLYGQANPAFTYTVLGTLLNGDTQATAVKGVPIYSTSASLGSPVGTYPVSIVGGLSSLNYLTEFQDGTFTVTPTTLTVALASSANPATYGGVVLFTATLPVDATGTITFLDGTAILGTESLSGGVATQPTISLTAGTHSITAQYGGDVNYGAAVSTPLSQVVNMATPIITLTSSLNPSTFGTTVNFRAALPTDATGTVTFLDGATVLGTGIIDTGVATLATSSLAGGTHSITAQYGGDSNYSAAVSTAVPQVVNLATPTVAIASSLNPSTFGASVTLTATVTSGATGIVTFHDGATTLGTGTISSGIATLAISSLAVGTHSITAHYGGDINYGEADSTAVSQVVNKATSTIALASSLNPSTFGASVTLTATVTSGATGTVTFHEGTTSLGTGNINSGIATLMTSSLTGGTHPITAEYGGDSNYNGAVSTPVSQIVNLAPSTVALASSPNPSTFGASVTLTATVTTGATGTVTFDDGATSLGTGTISSGIATLTTSSLAVGTHSITAQYGGDSNYNGAVSTPVSQTVNQASSTVALASSLNPSTFGASVTLTATVTSGATGTVTFHEGATSLGTGTISNGIATLATSTLTAGTHSITAQYGGDSNYSGAVSAPVSQTVNQASSTVALASSPNPSTFGASVTLTASVTSGATGSVTFHEGATTLGTGSISSGIATLTIGSLAVGTHSITAQYGGDSNYTGAVSTPVSQVINLASSTVALASSPNPSIFGASVTLTATVTSGATGTVTFHDGTTSLGTGTISTGVATLTTSSLGRGTHSITAQYGGDSNYTGAVSTPVSQVVNLASSTVALASSPNPSTFGASVTLTATVTSGATGTVTFHDGTTSLGTGTISSGIATLTTSSLAAGTHSITAQYGGDTNYSDAVSAPVSQTVNLATSTVALASSPNPSTFGASVTLTATVTSGATGTVTFHDGTTSLGTGTIGTGIATLTTSSLAVGTHSITAQYGGDSNYNGDVSTPVSQTVNQASSTVALASSPNPSTFGASVTLTATVTSGATGTVTFHDSTTSLGTGNISSGIATLTTNSLSVGTHSITAQYSGDSNYGGAVSTSVAQVVNMAIPTVALASSPNPSIFGATVTLTATVTSGATGMITFHDGTTALGTVTVASGVAVLTTNSLTVGTHPITAQYGGDSNYTGAVSTSVSQVVSLATPAVTLVSSLNPSTFGANVTFTATVTSGATGTVTFHDGTTSLGTVTIGSGVATLTTTSLAGGTHSITAQYGGDSNYNTAVSTPVSQVVNQVSSSVALASSLNPSTFGASVTLTANVTPGATGTVTFHDGTTSLGTGTISSGVAMLTTGSLAAGTHSITAQYGGDSSYNAAVSPPVAQVVSLATPAVALVSSLNPSNSGASVTFTATVPVDATGTLTFYDGMTALGTGTISSGIATLTTSSLASGTHSITAKYGGDSNHNSSVSSPLSQVVNLGAPASPLVSSLNPSAFGASVTFSITFPAGATGTVTFYDGTTAIGMGGISNGVAALTTSSLTAGTHSITAQYAGDAKQPPLVSAPLSQVVNPLSGTAALNVSPNPATQGSPVTLTMTLPASATGTVTFYDGTTILGTGPVVNGAATFTVTNLAAGSHSITAAYGGDANHAAATSPALSLTINPAVTADFNVINQTPAQLIPPGASASYQISITSVNLPFTNAVTLSATNLPQGATFTFVPSTITPGNAGATSTFTVSVPNQSVALDRETRVPLVLAFVLLPFAALKRARNKSHRLLMWLVVSFAFMGSAIGCGGGGYFNQPQKTYVITVTGTSGNLVRSTTATLTVQ